VARPRPWRIVCALATLLALAAAPARAQDLEAAVKATYLYKLAPFVVWPATAFESPADPLVICVQSADGFANLVERAVAGQHMGGHPIQVRRVARLERGAGCHIAYVAGSAAQSPGQALAAVEGSPVLTVTDAAHGGARGIVHLLLTGGRVRFSINASRADADGLGVSSKLLALAVEVAR